MNLLSCYSIQMLTAFTYPVELTCLTFLFENADHRLNLVPSEVVNIGCSVCQSNLSIILLISLSFVMLVLTFLLDHVLNEALLVVAFRNDIDQDVVLLVHPIDLVVLAFHYGPAPVPPDRRLDVFLHTRLLVLKRRFQILDHLEPFICFD